MPGGNLPLGKSDDADGERHSARRNAGRPRAARPSNCCDAVQARWTYLLANLDKPLAEAKADLLALGLEQLASRVRRAPGSSSPTRPCSTWRRTARCASRGRANCARQLRQIFNGARLQADPRRMQRDPQAGAALAACSSRCTCTPATATCTPTCRSTPTITQMLQDAHAAVARIMKLARSLDGVISGEHGIGITKLEFLTEDEIGEFRDYKQRVDPEGRFNKGKLLNLPELHADLRNAYTPSFGLMGHESLIMQQSDIGAIANSVKDCLRCGKCKPVCATHVPRANLLYSPRNKILATSLLVEAFLYEEQTRRGVSIKHWEEFEDVADHCTVCHKCVTPCPVDIDFGDVSMNMRNLLRKMDKKSFNPGTAAAMFFLNATDPATINATRKAMIGWGYKAQRLGNDVLKKFAKKQTKAPPATAGKPPVSEQVIHFINKKMPGNLPKKTARALLDIEDDKIVPIIRDPQDHHRRYRSGVLLPRLRFGAPVLAGRAGDAGDAVGSRRADRAAAGLPVLRLSAARRRPVRQGRKDDDRQPRAVPPHGQHAELPRHQDGAWCRAAPATTSWRPTNSTRSSRAAASSTSMNTCWRRASSSKASTARATCTTTLATTPMKLQDPVKTVNALITTVDNVKIEKNDRCCGESGTLAVTPSRHLDPGPLPQGRGDGQGRRQAARRRLQRRRQDPDLLPVLPAGPVALQRGRRHRRRLHRGRDGEAPAGRELAAGLCRDAPTTAASNGYWYKDGDDLRTVRSSRAARCSIATTSCAWCWSTMRDIRAFAA